MPEAVRAQQHSFVLPYAFTVSGGDWLRGGIGFSRVSGLDAEIGVVEWNQLTDPATPIKFPRESTYGDITLERGLDLDKELWTWWNETSMLVRGGALNLPRFTLLVTAFGKGALDNAGTIRCQWNVYAAWPRKVKWGDLDAQTSGMLVESLVLAHEGVQKL